MELSKTVAIVALLIAVLVVTGYAGDTDTTAAAKAEAAAAGYRR